MTQVYSTLYGGRYSVADSQDYAALEIQLVACSTAASQAAQLWSSAATQYASALSAMPYCPLTAQGVHSVEAMRSMGSQCQDFIVFWQSIAQECSDMASLVARVSGLYTDAEHAARERSTWAISGGTIAAPLSSAFLTAVYGVVRGVHSGGFSFTRTSRATQDLQEGLIQGLAFRLGGSTSAGGTMVNGAAHNLSPVVRGVTAVMQGDTVQVKQLNTVEDPIGPVSSIAQSLHGLRTLSAWNANESEGFSYATIGISQYRRDDGSSSWLVTIPGTDGHDDSPFGWAQNVEAMSDSREDRQKTDSVRMVVDAMNQAGIGERDPVVLVGHSQGGIVAASIAADQQDRFNIQHVITAGSPIAGHQISTDTWVTSIEMDDELVPALDGAANPLRESWLTVRGHAYTNIDGSAARLGYTPVTDASGIDEFTHALKYHEAAWRNASDLDTAATDDHDSHVSQMLDGEYCGSTFWQGRLIREEES